jgi:hypothetical protein
VIEHIPKILSFQAISAKNSLCKNSASIPKNYFNNALHQTSKIGSNRLLAMLKPYLFLAAQIVLPRISSARIHHSLDSVNLARAYFVCGALKPTNPLIKSILI